MSDEDSEGPPLIEAVSPDFAAIEKRVRVAEEEIASQIRDLVIERTRDVEPKVNPRLAHVTKKKKPGIGLEDGIIYSQSIFDYSSTSTTEIYDIVLVNIKAGVIRSIVLQESSDEDGKTIEYIDCNERGIYGDDQPLRTISAGDFFEELKKHVLANQDRISPSPSDISGSPVGQTPDAPPAPSPSPTVPPVVPVLST